MTHWVIGDVQGCAGALNDLIEAIELNPGDKVWFVGDLVNRGEDSLGALRTVKALCERGIAQTVLGNHDFHLLGVYAGVRRSKGKDTIEPILQADDVDELIDWLRVQPLMIENDSAIMVHAGLHPDWSLADARQKAENLHTCLADSNWQSHLKHWFTNPAHSESQDVSVFTRMRFFNQDGSLNWDSSDEPENRPDLVPWYDMPTPHQRPKIIFGHWSALGYRNMKNAVSTDTGAVWGRELTAVNLHAPEHIVQVHRKL